MPTVPLTLEDGRFYEVDVSPVNCGVFLQQPAAPRLTAADDVLELVPTPYVRALGALFMIVGVILFVVAPLLPKDDSMPIALIVFASGATCISIGLLFFLLAKKVTFDRQRGLLRIASALSKQDYPLNQVIAIQAIFGGWHKMEDERTHIPSYQLNLVFDVPSSRRVVLVHHGARKSIEELASSIAAFLDVPVVQHTEVVDCRP
jgi:hypothetical protein